jgi:hypothetical protein
MAETSLGDNRSGLDSRVDSLDDSLYEYTRDGFERAELSMMAMLAAERDLGLTFSIEALAANPNAMAYWLNRSRLLKAATMSGAFFLRDRCNIEEICRVSVLAFARSRFDLAWFRVPAVTATARFWTRIVPTTERRRLLVVGMARATREVLPLSDTYEEFLKGLGQGTRRNVHRYGQRARKAGIKFTLFEGFLPEASYDRVFALCARNGPAPFAPASVLAWRNRFSKQGGQFYSTLSTGSGELISLCRGFIWGGSAVIPYQLNSRDHYDVSPSLIHRCHLIERLIPMGVREIIFTDGCEGLLRNACLENHGSSALVIPLTPIAMAKACLFIASRYGAWSVSIRKMFA